MNHGLTDSAWRRRTTGFILGAIGVVCLCGPACENSEEPGLPPVPRIDSINPASASPGDTVVINGSNFADSPGANSIQFNNPVATANPFAGSTTRLSVVVPRDALSGPVAVSVPDQPKAGVGGALTVPARGVGEVLIFGKTGSPVEVPYPVTDAEYLLVPHATNPTSSYVSVFNYLYCHWVVINKLDNCW